MNFDVPLTINRTATVSLLPLTHGSDTVLLEINEPAGKPKFHIALEPEDAIALSATLLLVANARLQEVRDTREPTLLLP